MTDGLELRATWHVFCGLQEGLRCLHTIHTDPGCATPTLTEEGIVPKFSYYNYTVRNAYTQTDGKNTLTKPRWASFNMLFLPLTSGLLIVMQVDHGWINERAPPQEGWRFSGGGASRRSYYGR